MNRKKLCWLNRAIILGLAVLMIALALSDARAQEAEVSAMGGVVTSRNLGFENPSASLAIDGAFRTYAFRFESRTDIEHARKIETGNGWAIKSEMIGRYRLPGDFFLGAGAGYTRQHTTDFTKYGFRGIASFGKEFVRQQECIFPHIDVLFRDSTENHLRGLRIGADYKRSFGSEWGLRARGEFILSRFDPSEQTGKTFRVQVGLYKLWRK